MGQNGNGLKTDKNGNRTEIKRERNGITRPVVRTGDGNFFLTPTVHMSLTQTMYVLLPQMARYIHVRSQEEGRAIRRTRRRIEVLQRRRARQREIVLIFHNSINLNVSSSDQFTIFVYRTSAYHAGQIIIMRALFRVMASAHSSERFWNGRRSHCPIGPFWNSNFCRSVLERFGRERSRSHCA